MNKNQLSKVENIGSKIMKKLTTKEIVDLKKEIIEFEVEFRFRTDSEYLNTFLGRIKYASEKFLNKYYGGKLTKSEKASYMDLLISESLEEYYNNFIKNNINKFFYNF